MQCRGEITDSPETFMTPMPTHTLENPWISATFDTDTGSLVGFRSAAITDAPTLLSASSLSFLTMAADAAPTWYASAGGDDVKPVATTSVACSGDTVRVAYDTPALACIVSYHLAADQPLLRVDSAIRTQAADPGVHRISAPGFQLGEQFRDPYTDPEDLYCDGAELAPGLERPCWRVFYCDDRSQGLMVAAMTKEQMSHLWVKEDGLAIQPHLPVYCSTMTWGKEPPLRPSRRWQRSRLYLAPWQRDQHSQILRDAGLDEAREVPHRSPRGEPARTLTGTVYHAADVDRPPPAAGADDWQVVEVPWAQTGRALFATTGLRPPPLIIDTGLTGRYHLYVGIGNGDGVALRAGGDPVFRYRSPGTEPKAAAASPVRNYLTGPQRSAEADFGIIDLHDGRVELTRFDNRQRPCMIDYLRCVPEPAPKPRRRSPLVLSGFFDCPDVTALLDSRDPDPDIFAANIWAHSACGIRKIFWRVDGQCPDFPNSVNPQRPISARVHSRYKPNAKAYGRVLRRTNLLQTAVDAGAACGVQIWGWSRFNSYIGNVKSQFFLENPAFHELGENGIPQGKLCLAHPEVRRHKIDILVEAARHGLPGLNLGFLRTPPMLHYAPILCAEYEAAYGEAPPRDPDIADPDHRRTLPLRSRPDAYQRWWQFRARYLTTFVRELRAALAQADLAHTRLSVWLRPHHCLFDGIDLTTWLAEGLCDEVVSAVSGSRDQPHYWEAPDWQEMVQSHVPLIRMIRPWMRAGDVHQELRAVMARGYDGICFYESNEVVLDSNYLKSIHTYQWS